MLKWEIIHEMDIDDDESRPTCWASRIDHSAYGKFVWITIEGDGSYEVQIKKGEYKTLVKCKTLRSAKRWATIHLLTEKS